MLPLRKHETEFPNWSNWSSKQIPNTKVPKNRTERAGLHQFPLQGFRFPEGNKCGARIQGMGLIDISLGLTSLEVRWNYPEA